jgi:hypothetical protein
MVTLLRLINTTLVLSLQLALLQVGVAVASPLVQQSEQSSDAPGGFNGGFAAQPSANRILDQLANGTPPYSPPVDGGPTNTQGSGTR